MKPAFALTKNEKKLLFPQIDPPTKENDMEHTPSTLNAERLLALITKEATALCNPNLSLQFFAQPYPRKTYSYDYRTCTGSTETITSPVVTDKKAPPLTLLVTLNARLVQKMISSALTEGGGIPNILEHIAEELLRAQWRPALRQLECTEKEFAYAT